MTKYIDINCDLVGKIIGYGFWIIISGLILFATITLAITLQTYDENECFIDFYSKEQMCRRNSNGNLNWDYFSKASTESIFHTMIIFLIIIQLIALIILNIKYEWIELRCKD